MLWQFVYYLNIALEIVCRLFSSTNVCHPLYSTLSHPLFQQRQRSRLFDSTLRSKSLVAYSIGLSLSFSKHDNSGKPLVVEVVDHPLHSAPLISGICQPFEYLDFCERIEELYIASNVVDIVVYSSKTISLFAHYMPSLSGLHYHVLPPPWRCNINTNSLTQYSRGFNRDLKFLAICSSFTAKAAILLIDAWEQFLDLLPDQSIDPQLTLVCHDVPSNVRSSLPSSIVLIDKIPLTVSLKDYLFSHCHVYIACSVMDGIGPLEALSYGKPIISFDTINASQYVCSSNGYLLEIPFEYYDPFHYGTTWKLDADFLSLVTSLASRQLISNRLSDAMLQYVINPSLVDTHSSASRNHYYSRFTLDYFSQRLTSILSCYSTN